MYSNEVYKMRRIVNNNMRKQYQRKFTKLLRKTNKVIREDELWLGRVEVRQISARWEEFDDGSGGVLHTILRCIDKKTRQYKDYCFEYAPWRVNLYWHISMDILNKFFVEDLDVWRTGDPRNEIQDWTKVPIDPKALEKTKWQDLSISLYQLCKY
jgi:hypothetical protein